MSTATSCCSGCRTAYGSAPVRADKRQLRSAVSKGCGHVLDGIADCRAAASGIQQCRWTGIVLGYDQRTRIATRAETAADHDLIGVRESELLSPVAALLVLDFDCRVNRRDGAAGQPRCAAALGNTSVHTGGNRSRVGYSDVLDVAGTAHLIRNQLSQGGIHVGSA